MVRTRVGYAGGTTPSPTYHRLGDHTETIEIDYDPTLIGFEDILDVFWSSHDPRRPAPSRQYRSAVFFRTDEERLAAEESKARAEAAMGQVATSIEPLRAFHLAEDYHQKYKWKQFAKEWEGETAGQAPDWRSNEFRDWFLGGSA